MLSSKYVQHEREIYGFLSVLGDFGGVAQVVETVVMLLISPIAAHNFNLKAISKLYMAKTKDLTLFRSKKNRKVKQRKEQEREIKRNLSQKSRKILRQHRDIKLSMWQSFEIFLFDL